MTGRGFKVFTLFGIPVHVDWTFFLVVPLFTWLLGGNLMLYAGWVGLGREAADLVGLRPDGQIARPGLALVFGGLMTIGLYASVLVHEFGHALTARLFGVKTERVTLWFLGGIAGFERMPRQPGAEAVVAVVGPLTSFAVAGVLAIAMAIVPDGFLLTRLTLGSLSVLNLVLATFNLLPALPLDGGRVLRSLLALPLSYVRATQIAAGVSKLLAVLLGLYGLYDGGLMLIAIAVFVWMAVKAETRQSAIEAMLKGVRVRDVMTASVPALPPTASVGEAVQAMQATRLNAMAVVDEVGRVVGRIGVAELQASGGVDPQQSVASVMKDAGRTVGPDDPAVRAVEAISADGGLPWCAVVDDAGRVLGLVTQGDLVQFLQLRSFQRRAVGGAQPAGPVGVDPYVPPRPA